MQSRRSFLTQSSLIALSPTIPGFLSQSIRALAKPNHDDRVLVVVHLDGGNDGINTVVPIGDDAYAANRPELKLSGDRLIKIRDDLGLHGSMRSAHELLEDGKLAIVQAVGYPNPSRSHFRSTANWNAARFREEEHSDFGWLGRALDGAKRRRGSDSIFVGPEKLPLALRGRRSVASAILHDEDLSLGSSIKPQEVLGKPDAGVDLSAFVRRTVLDAYTTTEELSKATRSANSATRYPSTELGSRLRLVAQLIRSGLPTRVYYAIQTGYDTHAVQLPNHSRLLLEFSSAIKAFFDDLTSDQIADRVVLLAFSEFGRRVKENGSLGTDHGTAGPVFIAGPRVNAGVYGANPSLVDLEDGDLRMQFDFRLVYATLLEDWLGLESEPALRGRFAKMPLIRG